MHGVVVHLVDQQRAERLKWARENRGYETAADAAAAMGIPPPTYAGHENGSRGFRADSGERYAQFFAVNFAWLMTGKGIPQGRNPLVEKIEALPPELRADAERYIDYLTARKG